VLDGGGVQVGGLCCCRELVAASLSSLSTLHFDRRRSARCFTCDDRDDDVTVTHITITSTTSLPVYVIVYS